MFVRRLFAGANAHSCNRAARCGQVQQCSSRSVLATLPTCVYPALRMNDQAIPRQFDETRVRKSRLDFPQIVQKQGFQLIVVDVAC